MADPKLLTRNQIAAFVGNDPEAIRAIERLFRVAGELTPADIAALTQEVEGVSLAAGLAGGQAVQALSSLSRIAHALELLALAPPEQPPTNDTPNLNPPGFAVRRTGYGNFLATVTQTAAAINTAYAVAFDTTDLSLGVYTGTPNSRIYVDTAGVYNFQFSAQLDKTAGGTAFIWIWYRINGVDAANSATQIRIQGNNAETVAAWNFVMALKADDYFELMWSVDDLTAQITATAAAAPVPAIPAVILSVVDNIQI